MRVALLTTDTSHHTYFAWRMRDLVSLEGIVIETDSLEPPFETTHPFERDRDAYEREVLLAPCDGELADLAPSWAFGSANQQPAIDRLMTIGPDLVIVFGTGVLRAELMNAIEAPILNLHGGNPEEYRGLDTHLWAIYHGDFANLVTTLHLLEPELDTGPIVSQTALVPERGSGLHELRAVNTHACVDLCAAAVGAIERAGRLPSRPQIRRGRYYSFMPAALKERCVDRFAAWTAR